VSVEIGDIAPATENIIEVGPVPAAIPGLTLSVELVAPDLDVAASLSISSTWQSPVSIAAAVAVAVSVSVFVSIVAVTAATAELAIDVHNPAATAVNIVERRPNPAAIPRLASSAKHVADHVNGSAGLDVSAGGLPGSPAALEVSVVIDHFADATADIVQ
jgi:hypothetical protein